MTQKRPGTYRMANERLRKEGRKTEILSMRVSKWMLDELDALVYEATAMTPEYPQNRTKLFERYWPEFSKIVRERTLEFAKALHEQRNGKSPSVDPAPVSPAPVTPAPKSGFEVMAERMAALPPRKVEPPPMKPTATVPVPVPAPTPIVLPKLALPVEEPVEAPVEQVAPVATPQPARALFNPHAGRVMDISQAQIYTPPPRPEEDSTQLPEELTLSIPDFRLFTKPE